jgi:hypothetical protein
LEHRDDILARDRKYRSSNSETIRARRRENYVANREKEHERDRRYRAANAQKIRDYQRQFYASNRDKRRVISHRRLACKRGLPDAFTAADWQAALDHFGGCCAACGRPPGLWHTIAADHWIPLSSPNCPGTVPENIVPLCHGVDGCNNSKSNRPAGEWLAQKYGPRKARAIQKRIERWLKTRHL